MSNGVILLMLVLAVICVILATQPTPPPRSRRSRGQDQTKAPCPGKAPDDAADVNDEHHIGYRFAACRAPTDGTPIEVANEP